MKKLILLAACLLPLSTFAQKEFTISGKISTAHSPVMVFLRHEELEGKSITDSAAVLNGTFAFKGTATAPHIAMLAVRYAGDKGPGLKDVLSFYVENTRINISSTDSLRLATITGSAINIENEMLRSSVNPLNQQYININNQLARAEKANPKVKDEAWYKAKADTLQKVRAQTKQKRWQYIQAHPDSYFALLTFENYFLGSGQFDPKETRNQFDNFSASLKASKLGQNIAETITSVSNRQIGSKVIDFKQTDINGKLFTLSSLKGKYVLLDFWASWCIPCRKENPSVVKAYNELKGKKFEIVSVSLDQDRQAWENAIHKDGMPWIHVSDLKGLKNDLVSQFFIQSIPQNFLIDPNGIIVATNLRGENLDKQLSAFIK